jgi:hypothetical protein
MMNSVGSPCIRYKNRELELLELPHHSWRGTPHAFVACMQAGMQHLQPVRMSSFEDTKARIVPHMYRNSAFFVMNKIINNKINFLFNINLKQYIFYAIKKGHNLYFDFFVSFITSS